MPFSEQQSVHALTVLARLAQREQDVGGWIYEALLANPTGLLGPAIQVAVENGQPMPRYINLLLREADLPTDVLLDAYQRIPAYTLALRSTAALIAGELRDRGAFAGTAEGVNLAIEHAEWLLEIGDLAKAAREAREAVSAARVFVADRPGLVLHALRVLSGCLSQAGDDDDAIRTAQESVNLITLLHLGNCDHEGVAWQTLGQRLLWAHENERALIAFNRAIATFTALVGAASAAAAKPGSLWVPPGPTVPTVAPAQVGRFYYRLALTLMGQAEVLYRLGRPKEGLDAAVRAVRILRERAAEAPDAFSLDYAKAVLTAADGLFGMRASEPGGYDQALSLVWPNLIPAAIQMLRDSGMRRRLGAVQHWATYLVGLVHHLPIDDPEPLVEATHAQVDLSLVWLSDDRPEEAAIVVDAAAESAQALIARFGDEGRPPLQRALMARSRVREHAGDTESALADATEAIAAARNAESDVLRVVAAHSHSLRLMNAGRADEAILAEQDAIRQLMPLYEPDRTDIVFSAVTMTARLFILAEDAGRLGDLDDEILRFAASVVASFPGHRAAEQVLYSLSRLAFLTITAYARRNDSDSAAAVHRALIAVATRYPTDPQVHGTRLMVGFNALMCHLRTGRLDLATEVYDDVTALADVGGGTDEAALVEQAKCANALINVFIDMDFDRAVDLARAAASALRSTAYLAILPEFGESDIPGYLAWLDGLASRQGTIVGADTDPAVLAALDADYRATLTERRRTLGEDHPTTLATRLKFAEILRLRGLRAEARAELEATLALRRRLNGADHPKTRAVEERLANL